MGVVSIIRCIGHLSARSALTALRCGIAREELDHLQGIDNIIYQKMG